MPIGIQLQRHAMSTEWGARTFETLWRPENDYRDPMCGQSAEGWRWRWPNGLVEHGAFLTRQEAIDAAVYEILTGEKELT
jgi:hypothetical protein